MFENSRRIISECDLAFCHVFPYSPRPGTPAAKMPQVDPTIRKERAAILRSEGANQLASYLKTHIGQERAIVVEQDRHSGRTEHYTLARLPQDIDAIPGSLLRVRIVDATETELIANPL